MDPIERMLLERRSFAELERMRRDPNANQNVLGPIEHQALAREFTKENPLLHGAAMALATPAYSALKGIGYYKTRSDPSIEEVLAGYRGIGEGLSESFDERIARLMAPLMPVPEAERMAKGGPVRRPSIPRELPGSIDKSIEEMARLRRAGIAGVKGFTGLGEAPSVMRPEELEAYGTGETAGLLSDVADLIPGVGMAKALAGAGLGALKGGLGLAGMIRKGGDPSLFMTHSLGGDPLPIVNLLSERNPILTTPSIAVSRDNPYPFTKGATLVMSPESQMLDPRRQALYPRDAYTFRRGKAEQYSGDPRRDVRLTEGANPSAMQRLAINLMPRFRSMEGYEKSPFGAVNLGKFDEAAKDMSYEIYDRYEDWIDARPDLAPSERKQALFQAARSGDPEAQQIIRGSRMLPSEYGELKMIEDLPITRENVSAILLPEHMRGEETFKELGEQLGIPAGRAYDLATPSIRSAIDEKVAQIESQMAPFISRVQDRGEMSLQVQKDIPKDLNDLLNNEAWMYLHSPEQLSPAARSIVAEPMTMNVLKSLHEPLEYAGGGLFDDLVNQHAKRHAERGYYAVKNKYAEGGAVDANANLASLVDAYNALT